MNREFIVSEETLRNKSLLSFRDSKPGMSGGGPWEPIYEYQKEPTKYYNFLVINIYSKEIIFDGRIDKEWDQVDKVDRMYKNHNSIENAEIAADSCRQILESRNTIYEDELDTVIIIVNSTK